MAHGLPPDFESRYAALVAMIFAGEPITITEAAERIGIPADIVTIILAAHYAVADELLKLADPLGQSVH
jgi:hypothetical protein